MSEVKVNKISPRSGTTITLGDSGDTFTIPSGVTLSNAGTFTSFQSTGIDDNATSTAITIDSFGNIGIGTTNPLYDLHIADTTPILSLEDTDTNTVFSLNASSTSGIIQYQADVTSVGSNPEHWFKSQNRLLAKMHDNGDFSWYEDTGTTPKMFWDASTERLGIGTSSPSSALDVSGGLTVDGNNNSIQHNITRQTGSTNASRPVIRLTVKNTASDVTDGFGSAIQFRMKDNTADTELGALGFIRDGADGSGSFAVGQDSQLLHSSPQFLIDSSGNVGIGTSSPSGSDFGSNTGVVHIKDLGSSNTGLKIEDGTAKIILMSNGTNNYFGSWSNHPLLFYTNLIERMRIDSSGKVRINNTSDATYTAQLNIYSPSTLNCAIHCRTNTSGTQSQIIFGNSTNDSVGSIHTSGSSTAFNTSSDYRLKENVSYDFDATTRLKQLKPARFNFIADADTTVDGFLAHEVSSVVPEAITGEKDATTTKEKVVVNANGQVIAENIEQADWENGKIADEDGNTQYPTDSTWEATKVVPVYQGIDQAKLVPLLVKTIQELEARITALENA